MSESESKQPVDVVALAKFLAGLERAGLISVNRDRLKILEPSAKHQ